MWIGLAQDRDRWRTLVSTVINHRVPWNAGNFSTNCKLVSFSRRTLHHGVSKWEWVSTMKRILYVLAYYVPAYRCCSHSVPVASVFVLWTGFEKLPSRTPFLIRMFVFGILEIQIGWGESLPPSSPAKDLAKLLEEHRNLVYKMKKRKKAREFSTLSYDILVMPGNSRVVQHVGYYSFHLQKQGVSSFGTFTVHSFIQSFVWSTIKSIQM